MLLRRTLDTDSVKIMYSNGNGKLVEKATELLNQNDTIIVLLDTVPANKSIRDVYVALRRLSRQNDFRVIVWNIICAEYYFIKTFGNKHDLMAFTNNTDFDIVRDKLSYKESVLITTEEDKAFTKTFEKFCKLYIMKNGGKCINKTKTFFTDDCSDNELCINLTLDEKSEMYKNEYDCFKERLSVEKAWNIHKHLLSEANMMIDKYNRHGYKKIQPYPSIK
jgi:hypothetical protein